MYIFCCCKGKFPSIIALEGRLKHIYEIENFIATKIMKPMSFKQGGLHLKICNRSRSWIFIIMKLYFVS